LDKLCGDPSFGGVGANVRYLTVAPESYLTAIGPVPAITRWSVFATIAAWLTTIRPPTPWRSDRSAIRRFIPDHISFFNVGDTLDRTVLPALIGIS